MAGLRARETGGQWAGRPVVYHPQMMNIFQAGQVRIKLQFQKIRNRTPSLASADAQDETKAECASA